VRYLALVGPTASGKTDAVLALARHYPLEIISVDSALVYRGMDIGTAKPTLADRCAVPHHLIDIRDPLSPYSAAEFAVDARALMADIHARGKWPLLVGGTLLYLHALRQGLDALPRADLAWRSQLQERAALTGWPALHAELALHDPITAARLASSDAQRISRALEVYYATGRPLSSYFSHHPIANNALLTGIHAEAEAGTDFDGDRSNSLLISLEPQDRAWLHRRISQRCDAMFEGGLVDEVAALRGRGDLHPDLPAMRCVGYRQAWQALDGRLPMSELPYKVVCATRQLAKRQLTWLRSMPERCVVACDAPDAQQQVFTRVRAFVHGL